MPSARRLVNRLVNRHTNFAKLMFFSAIPPPKPRSLESVFISPAVIPQLGQASLYFWRFLNKTFAEYRTLMYFCKQTKEIYMILSSGVAVSVVEVVVVRPSLAE